MALGTTVWLEDGAVDKLVVLGKKFSSERQPISEAQVWTPDSATRGVAKGCVARPPNRFARLSPWIASTQ